MGAGDDGRGGLDRRLEAEGLVEEVQVVVDGLGDADDADGQIVLLDLLDEGVCAALGAVAADGEEHVDVEAVERLDHLLGGLLAA